MDANDGTKKLKFGLGDWFSWSGTIAPAKGTAAGSVHLNFSKKSGLVAALGCALLAVGLLWLPIRAWFGAGVLTLFAAHHVRRWWRTKAATDRIPRQPARVLLAGVCARSAERLHVGVWIVRCAFAVAALAAGTGIVVYSALWIAGVGRSATAATSAAVQRE